MPAYVKPTLKVEIDFTGNPTASYPDIQAGDPNTISFWKMNSAGSLLDSVGSNDGVIVGTPSTTTGAFPYVSDLALAFDGSADSAYVPSALDLSFSGPMTVSFWFKVASLPGATRVLVAKYGSWYVRLDASGHVIGSLKNDTATGTVTGTTTVTTGVWHHVALVYTGTAVNLYVDGLLEGTSAYSGGMGLEAQPIKIAETLSTSQPTWQSSTTNQSATSNTSMTGTAPASIASGDLLIAHTYVQAGGSTTVTVVPSGWNLLYDQALVAGGSRTRVYWKIATGSEPGTYVWTLSANQWWVVAVTRITGHHPTNPFPEQVYDAFGTSTAVATGSHLPNFDNALIYTLFSSAGQFPAGWSSYSSGTERYDRNDLNAFHAIAGNTQVQTTATALSVTANMATGGGQNTNAIFLPIAGAGSLLAVDIDDISIRNAALSATEVALQYASRSSGSGTWVDVSADARQVQIRGGRQYELDRMEARTATVVFRDELRKYDPANQSSVYWPNVVPMRRIRVSLVHSAVTYPVFTGFVERWPPETIGPRYQEVTVSAVDGFDGLARASLSGSVATTFSGAQIDAILSKAYWPETDRNLDAGQYVMIGDSDLNTTALQAIQDIADSELGVFFLDGDGQATFHDRAHRGTNSRSTTSQASFVETSNSTVTYHELSPSFDRDRIINTWEISPHSAVIGGTVQTATDADSIAKYFLRTSSRSTKLSSNTDALAQANQLLNETAQPALRFDVLVLVPYTSAQWAAVLPLQISDRVTVTRTPVPSAGGTTIVRDCFIEGMSWAITPSSIQFSLQLSPVSSGDYYHTIVRDGPVSYWRMDTVT